MMEEWIKRTFDVVPKGWRDQKGVEHDAFTFGGIVAPIDWFCAVFGGVAIPPSASALKMCDPNDNLGWHRHFDVWVAQGIISP